MRPAFARILLLSVAIALSSAAQAAEWATLKGRLIYDGTPPEPIKLEVNKDRYAFGSLGLTYERLVVGADRGLANVLVYIRTPNVDVHPDYEKHKTDNILLETRDGRFNPHIVLLRTTQNLQLENADSVAHSANFRMIANTPQNLLVLPGTSTVLRFPHEERLPCNVWDNIHSWMDGRIVVRENPYMTVTDSAGRFTLKDVPAGSELEFQLWHERAGYLKDLPFTGGKTDVKGRFTLTLKPGETDLGEMKVPPSAVQK